MMMMKKKNSPTFKYPTKNANPIEPLKNEKEKNTYIILARMFVCVWARKSIKYIHTYKRETILSG